MKLRKDTYYSGVALWKKFFIGTLTAIFAVWLNGCVSDEVTPTPNIEPDTPSSFYLTLNVSLPSSGNSRSTTTDEGNSSDKPKEGRENENKITSAYIYIFNKADNKLLGYFYASGDDMIKTKASDAKYSLVAKIEDYQLLQMAGKELSLYVVANNGNMPQTYFNNEESLLEAKLNATALEAAPVKAFGTDGNGQECPMSNKKEFSIDLTKVKLPDGESDDAKQSKLLEIIRGLFTDPLEDKDGVLWDVSKKVDGLYEGAEALELERSVARIDYKPGKSASDLPDNVYKLEGAKLDGRDVYLKIVSMQLFNISKEAFIFRHTAEGDLTAGEAAKKKAFGVENGYSSGTVYNWVYDTDWGYKNNAETENGALKSGDTPYFLNQPQTEEITGSNDYDWIVPGTKAYTTMEVLSEGPIIEGYYPWYYVMENTLPSTDKMNLQLSTGIVFRVALCEMNGNLITGTDSKRITLADYRYKVIQPSNANEKGNEPAGYYLTYKYLIEHNRNKFGVIGEDGAIQDKAPMQIGIVRNNIYQISVSSFSNIPSPEEPDNFAIAVQVKVLPWVKHDIEINW